MRTFRKAITELPMNAALEASDFQQNLWRYPVRFETALEYLKFSPDEYATLYSGKLSPTQIIEQTWFESVIPSNLSGIFQYALYYVRLVLRIASLSKFGRVGDEKDFPDCEPCCLSNLSVSSVMSTMSLCFLRSLSFLYNSGESFDAYASIEYPLHFSATFA